MSKRFCLSSCDGEMNETPTITTAKTSKLNNLVNVVSSIDSSSIEVGDDNFTPLIGEHDSRKDALDDFNHPRIRRLRILWEVYRLQQQIRIDSSAQVVNQIVVEKPCLTLEFYASTHAKGLLDFLSNAWERWSALGPDGQDPMSCLLVNNTPNSESSGSSSSTPTHAYLSPPLIPGNSALPREPYQKPSQHVIGQMGYYCTDNCTPIFDGSLLTELLWDAAIMERAAHELREQQQNHARVVVYALPIHPGHHAARDSFGGYCYVNHAAAAARQLLQHNIGGFSRVAILDVDYHAGNGTASIFYEESSVLVVSIHCDPDHEYPFHSGFADQTGTGAGLGATLHLPLPPNTTWEPAYRNTLLRGLAAIQEFGADALVISLGLDALEHDPCAIRRAGFRLAVDDFSSMGNLIRQEMGRIPILVTQEGGYRMDCVAQAAVGFVRGLAGNA